MRKALPLAAPAKPLQWLSLTALVSGLLLPLAMAPFKLWPLAWVSLAGFFWICHQAATRRQAFWLGWIYGAGLFSFGISWVYASMRTVATPIPLSVLLTALFCLSIAFLPAIQAWLYHRFIKPGPLALALGAPALWLIFEGLRSWLFTGMPWLLAGYAATETPLAQLAAIGSVYGLSLIIALAASQLTLMLTLGRTGWLHGTGAIAMTAMLMGAGWLLPATSWTTPTATVQTVAVQSNVRQAEKWLQSQVQPTLDFYAEQAREHTRADLMIWPEAALTARPARIQGYLEQMDTLGQRRSQGIITGVITREDDRYYNALIGLGTASGEYRKQHLVPFGEYLPFEAYLRGLIAFFNIPMSTLSPAIAAQTPMPWEFKGEMRHLAPIICYEAAYPGLVRELAQASDLLVMVSNDAWFGDSLAPHQHLEITRMRAIENSRALVRSTQTGISALIDANGRILARSRQFEVAAVKGEVTLRQGLTPYQRWGSPLWMLLPLTLLAGYLLTRTRNPHQTG